MNMKRLITASIFAVVSTSAVRAADTMIAQQPELFVPQVIVESSNFSWSGFYLGGQIGSFSSKSKMNEIDETLNVPVGADFLPKISGFIGGLYAGSNIDLSNGFILGIDTDIMWVGRKDTKTVTRDIEAVPGVGAPGVGAPIGVSDVTGWTIPERGVLREGVPDVGNYQGNKLRVVSRHALKQKWSGATQVRIGFSIDRIMPYIAGGVAYTQLRDILSEEQEGKEVNLLHSFDQTKTLVGYSLSAGVDFAIIDNLIVRGEYRYANFGKEKFAKGKFELGYKTNDFRAGLAYKF